MHDKYFPKNYTFPWFPRLYFIIEVIRETDGKVGVGAGGSYLLAGEELFPSDLFPKNITPVRIQTTPDELPKVLDQVKKIIDDEDEEEAIILIQIISSLPHYFEEKRQAFKISADSDIVNIINYVADVKK